MLELLRQVAMSWIDRVDRTSLQTKIPLGARINYKSIWSSAPVMYAIVESHQAVRWWS